MAIGDIWQLRIATSMGTQTAINISHWQESAIAGTGATTAQKASALNVNIRVPLKNAVCSAATFRGVGIQHIWPLPITIEVTDLTGAGACSNANAILPLQVSGLTSLRTNTAGKKGHGRMYVPFPTVNDVNATGQPTGAYVVLLNVIGNNLSIPVTAGGGGNTTVLTPVLWNKTSHVATPIINFISRTQFATQRRRGDFGRPNPPPF